MASFQKFDIITVTPAAAVANAGTVTFTYPTTSPARAAASYKSADGAVLAVKGLQKVFEQGAGSFTLAYGASSVVLTHDADTTWPAGKELTIQIPLADYEDLTDSSTGTASNTLAAGVGVETVAIPVTLASISGAGDVLTNYTPGYKFKLLAVDFAVGVPVTTGAKAATLNAEIGTTNVTGGAVALTSANCTPLGAVVAGSAVTAANTGSSTDTISIEAASVTAFAEGTGYVLLKIQNMDTADAVASLASKLAKIMSTGRAFDTFPDAN